MERPRLTDYGLTGLESRPRADWDNHPLTDEEYVEALRAVVRYQAETRRVVAFRDHLKDYEWQEFEKEKYK